MTLRNRRRLTYLLLASFAVVLWFNSDVFWPTDVPYTTHEPAFQKQSDVEPFQQMEQYRQEAEKLEANLGSVPFKKILFWNEAYGSKTYGIGFGPEAFKKAGCPVWQCEGTDNRSMIPVQDFDAILFHLRSWKADDVPARRSQHQRYIFWSMESPAYRIVNTDLMRNFFNWTMTYRWDSDVVQPYGWTEPNGSLPLHPDPTTLQELFQRPGQINYARGKSKMAAWFVSNCNAPSARNALVKRLKKYLDIDIYGQCGNLLCPRTREQACRTMVQAQYKFYLSLENSLCRDYVTEKFWSMMHFNIVPVVLSLHGTHDRLAPPHSFINAMDFKSVKKLAQYLRRLDANDTEYSQYFWWKGHYRIRNGPDDFNAGMCQLCAALHRSMPSKVYADMTQWWDRDATCATLKFS